MNDYTHTMLASATAGIMARIPTHPIDTCKARLQVEQARIKVTDVGKGPKFRTVFGTLLREQGLAGLYRGFAITALGSAPASMLYFTSYEMTRNNLLQVPFFQQNSFLSHFSAGLIAESISCILWVPIDVVKERMQVQRPNSTFFYKSGRDAIRTIYKQDGPRGFYRAYGATVLSFGPFSALYFMFYEKLKAMSMRSVGTVKESETPLGYFLMSGALAGATASFFTNPLDMVKLRLQVQRAGADSAFSFGYRNIFHGMYQMVRQEGVASLFRGVVARMAFHAPATAIQIASFEEMKQFYQRYV